MDGSKNENTLLQKLSSRQYDLNSGMQWTRTRVKAIESEICNLANIDQSSAGIGINISKTTGCQIYHCQNGRNTMRHRPTCRR